MASFDSDAFDTDAFSTDAFDFDGAPGTPGVLQLQTLASTMYAALP